VRVHAALAAAGAVPRFVGARLGRIRPSDGDAIDVEVTMETAPSVLWDGVVVPGGDGALAALGQAVDFVKDQYRHCKTIGVLGAKSALLDRAMLPTTLPDGSDDRGLVMAGSGDAASAFIAALARHRHFERETDPPAV
jgi:catalase